MKALLSGELGTALLFENQKMVGIDVNSDVRTVSSSSNLNWLLRDATDVAYIEDLTQEDASRQLELAWQRDRALPLMLILLDSDEEYDTRRDACECLTEFALEEALKHIGNYLYAAPFPRRADPRGAATIAKEIKSTQIEQFLLTLCEDQEEITLRRSAWDALSLDLFGSIDEKESFKKASIRVGAFRLFVTERNKKDSALFQLLAAPEFRGKAKARSVLTNWAAPFKEKVSNVSFAEDETFDVIFDSGENAQGGHLVYQNVERQKNAIKDLLVRNKKEQALQFIAELVQSQHFRSKPEHISKSLCDLAQHSKQLGDIELQLELSQWATREFQTDPWAYAQVADAYRALGEYEKALDAYQSAGALGNRQIALCGRGLVLKDLGQFKEALEIFKACAAEFPSDAAARCGEAEVVKELGKLNEAFALYEKIARDFPYEPVALNGRATVLRDLGKLTESLAAYDEALKMFPNDLVTLNARSEVLRQAGRFPEALTEFRKTSDTFPLDQVCRIGIANVLKDSDSFAEAFRAFSKLIDQFPMAAAGYVGRSEVLKRQHMLPEALASYSEAEQRFPRSSSARVGLASVLAAMGRYDECFKRLPSYKPATFSEWVGFHIRGLACLRKGDIAQAIEVLEWGVDENPWANQKVYFETALAGAKIRIREPEQAIRLLEREPYPTLRPIVCILQLHAYAEIGDSIRAKGIFETFSKSCPVALTESLNELAIRYGLSKGKVRLRHREWLYDQECDSLLLAA